MGWLKVVKGGADECRSAQEETEVTNDEWTQVRRTLIESLSETRAETKRIQAGEGELQETGVITAACKIAYRRGFAHGREQGYENGWNNGRRSTESS